MNESSRGRGRCGDGRGIEEDAFRDLFIYRKEREKHQRIRATRKYQAKRSGDVVRGSTTMESECVAQGNRRS